LRDSGSIEQEAGLVCFLYSDAKYNPGQIITTIEGCQFANDNVIEINIPKYRNGEPNKSAYVYFDGGYQKFTGGVL